MTIYLYVKRHTKTGLLYFGKTTKKDPYKYTGSGKYWLNHITKHGKEYVDTVWLMEFTNVEECCSYAEQFSTENDIANSSSWANLKPETGLDGGSPKGRKGVKGKGPPPMLGTLAAKLVNTGRKRTFTPEHKHNISNARKGKPRHPQSAETRQKISTALSGRVFSEESKQKMSAAKKGVVPWNKGTTGLAKGSPGKRHRCSCISCHKEMGINNLNSHFRVCVV